MPKRPLQQQQERREGEFERFVLTRCEQTHAIWDYCEAPEERRCEQNRKFRPESTSHCGTTRYGIGLLPKSYGFVVQRMLLLAALSLPEQNKSPLLRVTWDSIRLIGWYSSSLAPVL